MNARQRRKEQRRYERLVELRNSFNKREDEAVLWVDYYFWKGCDARLKDGRWELKR